MEIKQGDKVKVSENAPKAFDRFKGDVLEYDVVEISHSTATIEHSITGDYGYALTIPTKYLVNVDAEAKEAKYHKGDRVRHIKNDECGIVLDVEADGVYVGVAFSLQRRFWKNREIEPVQPTEQTETSADALGSYTLIPVSVNPIIGFEQEYWKKYAADLAKEIALKVANKFNDPNEAAEYAVSVAKAVVEGLKGK